MLAFLRLGRAVVRVEVGDIAEKMSRRLTGAIVKCDVGTHAHRSGVRGMDMDQTFEIGPRALNGIVNDPGGTVWL